MVLDEHCPSGFKRACQVLVAPLVALLESDQITPFGGSEIEGFLLAVLGRLTHGRTAPPEGCSPSLFRRASSKFLAD